MLTESDYLQVATVIGLNVKSHCPKSQHHDSCIRRPCIESRCTVLYHKSLYQKWLYQKSLHQKSLYQ